MAIKRAVLYARVSTARQVDGYSLPTQLVAMREYAKQNKFRVLGEYQDDFTGNSPVAERPQGKEIYVLLKRRAIDAVILYTVDRVARDEDVLEFGIFKRDCRRAGVELHFCDTGKTADSVTGGLLEHFKAAAAAEELQKIRERTTRGRIAKAKAGKPIGAGCTPYGYKYQDDSFVIVEAEAKIIKQIYKWYVYGEEDQERLTANGIAKRLSTMRVSTPGERYRKHRTRASGIWDASTVSYLLSCETYAGIWHYRKTKGKNRKDGEADKNEIIAIPVPPIVDRALWDAAQKQREQNKRYSIRNCQHFYLLRGMVHCGECSFAMVGTHSEHKYFYYRCITQQSRFVDIEGKGCGAKRIRADRLEKITWDYITNVVMQAPNFEQALRAAQQAELDVLIPKRERLETVKELVKDCEKKARKLAKALIHAGNGVIGQTLQDEIDETEKRYAALCQERDTLQESLNAKTLTEESIKNALDFRTRVADGIDNPTPEDKRRVLEFLQTQVIVQKGQAKIKCLVPVEEGMFDLDTSWSFNSPRINRMWSIWFILNSQY